MATMCLVSKDAFLNLMVRHMVRAVLSDCLYCCLLLLSGSYVTHRYFIVVFFETSTCSGCHVLPLYIVMNSSD